MNIIIPLHNRSISVRLRLHAIKIYNNDELLALLKYNAKALTSELIACIKQEYFKLFNTDFKVQNASMAIEIWAHIYIEKFTEAIKSLFPFKLIKKIAAIVIAHCKEIDIGEPGHDDNRFVWDALAVFRPAVAWLLFRSQANK